MTASAHTPRPGRDEPHVIDATRLDRDLTLDTDVVIVGTGAGGGTAAEILTLAGLRVVMIEEGPYKTARDFRMRELEAYSALYQESAGRRTSDGAIGILQGRCVGGGTTVNWTSSFRTPPTTLAHWATHHGVAGYAASDLEPWFLRLETHLGIAPWTHAPNANNEALARGAARLGIPCATIRRNVRGCADLGYCGMGCPLDAKQSMLVTSIPAALARGATLVSGARAERFVHDRRQVEALRCYALDADGVNQRPLTITVRARHFIAAAGAIGTPALLLRSRAPDPYALLGKRTFLHPVVVCAALMPEVVAPYAGSPQSVYSDHFLESQPVDAAMGFKLEVPPVHPVLAGITFPGHGVIHSGWMRELPHLHVAIALLRDGFHHDSPGGAVSLRDDGSPRLDYPLTDYVWDGVRRAFATIAEIQFAAGATKVMPVHRGGPSFATAAEAREAIASFDLAPRTTPLMSAHVMGGCPFGRDPKRSVVDLDGRHHQLARLHVIDGSLFPTSIGANPQLSIYAVAARLSSALAESLTGRPVPALPAGRD